MTKLIEPVKSAGMRGAKKQAIKENASMIPKTASDGFSDSYFSEGEIYAMMEKAEKARRKRTNGKKV